MKDGCLPACGRIISARLQTRLLISLQLLKLCSEMSHRYFLFVAAATKIWLSCLSEAKIGRFSIAREVGKEAVLRQQHSGAVSVQNGRRPKQQPMI